MWHSGEPDPGLGGQRRQGPHHRRKQCRCRRFRHGLATQSAAGEEGDRLLRRREQGVRAPGAGRRAGPRPDTPGNARGEVTCRRRRRSRLFHPHRLRNKSRRRQRHPGLRRHRIRSGRRHPRRRGHRQGVERGQGRQPGLPEDGAQLQPDDRHLRHGDGGRGGRTGRRRRPGPRPGPYPRHLCGPDHRRPQLREAHRVPHHQRWRGAEARQPDPRADGPVAPLRSCATATT